MSTPKLISGLAIFPQDRRLGILKKVAYYRESEKRNLVLIVIESNIFIKTLYIRWLKDIFSFLKTKNSELSLFFYTIRLGY